MNDAEKEDFRRWVLARMKLHEDKATAAGRWQHPEAVAACVELWACLDKVLGLGVADPNHRAYLDRHERAR